MGYKRPLQQEDLFNLPENISSEYSARKFEEEWNKQLKRRKPSIIIATAKSFGGPFLFIGILKLIHDILLFSGPIILNQ